MSLVSTCLSRGGMVRAGAPVCTRAPVRAPVRGGGVKSAVVVPPPGSMMRRRALVTLVKAHNQDNLADDELDVFVDTTGMTKNQAKKARKRARAERQMELERERQRAAAEKNSTATKQLRQRYVECVKQCGDNGVCVEECRIKFKEVI